MTSVNLWPGKALFYLENVELFGKLQFGGHTDRKLIFASVNSKKKSLHQSINLQKTDSYKSDWTLIEHSRARKSFLALF